MSHVKLASLGLKNELCYTCSVLALTHGATRLPDIPSESICFQRIRWTPSDDLPTLLKVLFTLPFHLMITLPVTQEDSTVLAVSFFDWTPSDSWFWPLESGREYRTCVAYFPGHSFPVRNDISHAEQELQQDKKRHWPSHFKSFKLQHKAMTNLKVTHPNIFCKVPMIA